MFIVYLGLENLSAFLTLEVKINN